MKVIYGIRFIVLVNMEHVFSLFAVYRGFVFFFSFFFILRISPEVSFNGWSKETAEVQHIVKRSVFLTALLPKSLQV